MRAGPLLALGAAGIFLATRAAKGSPSSGGSGGSPKVTKAGRSELHAVLAAVGIDGDWATFFDWVAKGESGWSSTAKNDTPSEAGYAAKAYKRKEIQFAGCPWTEDLYTFGSGGWFGFLPAVGVLNLPKDYRCIDPAAIFSGPVSVAMAVGFAHGLMGWPNFKPLPTFGNLRIGWGWPSGMSDPKRIAAKFPKYEKSLAKLGVGPEFLHREVGPLVSKAKAAEILKPEIVAWMPQP